MGVGCSRSPRESTITDHCVRARVHSVLIRRENLKTLSFYDPNARDLFGNTPLHINAIYGGEPSNTRILLQQGADPNAVENTKRRTPLHLACKYRASAMVNVLVAEASIDLQAVDIEGNSCLHFLFSGTNNCSTFMAGGYVDPLFCICFHLIANGSNMFLRNVHGHTPMDYCIANGYGSTLGAIFGGYQSIICLKVYQEQLEKKRGKQSGIGQDVTVIFSHFVLSYLIDDSTAQTLLAIDNAASRSSSSEKQKQCYVVEGYETLTMPALVRKLERVCRGTSLARTRSGNVADPNDAQQTDTKARLLGQNYRNGNRYDYPPYY